MFGVVSYKFIYLLLLLSSTLPGCLALQTPVIPPPTTAVTTAATRSDFACPVTRAEWAVHPEDSAIMGTPAYGYYLINQDQSIWASTWWWETVEFPLRASKEGNKVGWFRPDGEMLEITGRWAVPAT